MKPGQSLNLKIIAGLLLLTVMVWAGRHFGHHIPAIEQWISGQGALGYITFIVIAMVFTSLLVPDTVFAVAAGVIFGLARGSVLMVVTCLLTAAFNFSITRYFLREKGRRWLDKNPSLRAIEEAVSREGFRIQFLLRLTPINPVTVSYLLGVTNTRIGVFLAANLGLIPCLLVEVYFGYVAKHAAKVAGKVAGHSELHLIVNLCGLACCAALLIYITRLARRALAESTELENKKKETTHERSSQPV